jgi:hypothetical protein
MKTLILHSQKQKSAFCPRLVSSLGCASARKLRPKQKRCTFGLDAQIIILFALVFIFFLIYIKVCHGGDIF